MDNLKNDDRFKDALTNSKYLKLNKKNTKIKLDKRFKRILTDKDFTLKYSVDSKGRPLKESAKEDLKKYFLPLVLSFPINYKSSLCRYYEYSDDEEEKEIENEKKIKKPGKASVKKNEKEEEEEDEEEDDDEEEEEEEEEESSSSTSSNDESETDSKSLSEGFMFS